MIKIEFPADRLDIAAEFSKALSALGGRSGSIINDLVSPSPAQEDDGPNQNTDVEPEDDGLNNEGDAIDNTSGPEAGDRRAADEIPFKDYPAANANTRVDTKGVAFNTEFCGEAAVPFYASGKNKGQWKKKKGVTEEAYGAWYLSATPAATSSDAAPLDTAGAFGGQQPATDKKPIPKDCGEFMGWVSAQQAAGQLNPIDITDAYGKLNLAVADLFSPTSAAKIEEHVRNLYAMLGGLE